MLKRTLLVSCFGLLLAAQNVQAGDAAQTGAWGGAAGGAILGQAIGRDTKGTLIGTAIGGVLGYMIGNEMEKEQSQTVRVYSRPPRVVHQYEDDDEYRVVHYRPVVYCPPQRVVRETVIIDRNWDEPRRWRHHGGYYRDHGRHASRFNRGRD